jgi:hypothetical protein
MDFWGRYGASLGRASGPLAAAAVAAEHSPK